MKTGVGCHFLLQEIFPTQGLNSSLLHCRQTLYDLSHMQISKYDQSELFSQLWNIFQCSTSAPMHWGRGEYGWWDYLRGQIWFPWDRFTWWRSGQKLMLVFLRIPTISPHYIYFFQLAEYETQLMCRENLNLYPLYINGRFHLLIQNLEMQINSG